MPKKKETERADKRLPLYVDVESFEPPRYLEEDNTNGWELVSRNDWTFEILRYNKTGMVLYPFFVKSKRSKVSDDNLAGAMCFTSEGERVTPVPKHIRAVCEKYRQMFLKKWNGRRYDPKDVSNFEDISRPKRGTEQRKEEEHDEDDNDPEPRKRTPKKGKRKQRKSGESSYKYPMTLRLLKAEVERVTKIITHRMGIEEESKKGIAFIDKDSDLQRLYKTEKETGRKTREYLKVRATGVKLVEGKSPRIAPILKIGNKHIEYKAAGALKYVYSIALGIPIGEVKEKAGLGQLKGYTKLVELADRDKPLNDLYQIVSDQEYFDIFGTHDPVSADRYADYLKKEDLSDNEDDEDEEEEEEKPKRKKMKTSKNEEGQSCEHKDISYTEMGSQFQKLLHRIDDKDLGVVYDKISSMITEGRNDLAQQK